MKTIEQKAKAYDNALKVLHKYDGANIMFSQSLKEEMFPELAESEDEMIRKALIEHFRWNTKQILNAFSNKKALAWLEKQGEKKPLSEEDERIRKEIIATIHLYYGEPLEDEAKEMIAWLEKQGDPTDIPADAVLHDNKDGLIAETIRHKREKQGEQKSDTDFSDLRTWKYIVDTVLTEKDGIGQYLDSTFTKEVANKLQKRFGNIEQKPTEWSEENKYLCTQIEGILQECWIKNLVLFDLYKKMRNFIKSLRSQNTWKPSEEMLEALYRVIPENVMDKSEDEMLLDKLYQGLKYGKVLSEK